MDTRRHPHAYTLQLLEFAIDHLPPTYPEESKKRYRDRLAYFRHTPAAPYEDIRLMIAELGKSSWPVRKAYEDLYGGYGRPSEESHLLENLDEGVRAKFERFVGEGGKIEYVASPKSFEELRQPSPFERYFTPEEKFAIEQALLAARDQAREEIDSLVTDKKKDEYRELVSKYREEQRRIEDKLEELRDLAKAGGKWEGDIIDQVRTFEEGWSVLERSVELERVIAETEYWKGTIQQFLHV